MIPFRKISHVYNTETSREYYDILNITRLVFSSGIFIRYIKTQFLSRKILSEIQSVILLT